MNPQKNILKLVLFLLVVSISQLSYADYDSFTVNVPNSQGGYTSLVIKKSGNGYVGPKGETYTNFPTVNQLQSAYNLGNTNTTVVTNTNNETQTNNIGLPQNNYQENIIDENGFVITKDFISMDQCRGPGQAKGTLGLLDRFLGGVNEVEFKKKDVGEYYIIYYGKIKDIHGYSHSVYNDVTVGDRMTLIRALSCFWNGEDNLEAKIVNYIKKIDSTEPADLNNLNYEEPAGFDITTPDSDKLSARMMYNSEGHYGVIFYKNILDTNGNPFTVISSTNIFSKDDLQNDINSITQELNSSLNEELKSPLSNFTKEDIKKWEDLSNAGDMMVFKKDKLIMEFAKERNERKELDLNWSGFLDAGTKIADRAFKEKLLKKINEFDQPQSNQSQINRVDTMEQKNQYTFCDNYELDQLIKYDNGQYFINHPNTLYKLEGQVIQSVNNGVLFVLAINQIIAGGDGQLTLPALLYTGHSYKYGESLYPCWVEFAGYVQYNNKRLCSFRMVKSLEGNDL